MWRKAELDPYVFLTEFAYTLDEYDSKSPIKLIPKEEYIEEFVRIWQKERKMLVPKSRRMLATWICIALYLWDTMVHKARKTFVQSQKEDPHVKDLIHGRAYFIYEHLPEFVRNKYPCKVGREPHRLDFVNQDSFMLGCPQGSEVVRQFGATGYFGDEFAFQSDQDKTMDSVIPALGGVGRATFISSPNYKDVFYEYVEDLK